MTNITRPTPPKGLHQINTAGRQMIDSPPLVYRINRACSKLGVSRSTIYRLVRQKKLDMVKISERASGITAESIGRHLMLHTQ